ncbi:hypothetical protein QF012_005243 [Pseudomonas laurylsulfatiphila]
MVLAGLNGDSRPTPHKDENVADAQPPQRMDPQDILKLLMALRWAVNTKAP